MTADADRARVLEWLLENPRRGYKACARALDLDYDQVRAWGKEARSKAGTVEVVAPPSRARASPPPPPVPDGDCSVSASALVGLGDLDYYRTKCVQLEQSILDLMQEERVNAAGLAALQKRALDARAELIALRDQAPDPLEDMTPEQRLDAWRRALREMPDEHLELALAVYATRHKARLFVSREGGHRAELLADEERWITDKEAS